jgi:predicted phage-related endonuclease
MPIERRIITDEAEWLRWRREDVTASVIAALFGLHPYETVYGLAAQKRGMALSEPKSSPLLDRGREFQEIVGRYIQRDHPTWKLRVAQHYLRDAARRLGGTPDFYVTIPGMGRGIIEAKSVASLEFRRSWSDGVPAWVALQTLTCAMLARARFAIVAAIVMDPWKWPPELHEYHVPRHKDAERRLLEGVAKFWAAIDAGQMPDPDYSRDGGLIHAMMPHVTHGKTIDLTADNRMPELLMKREELKARIAEMRDLEKQCKTIETEIYDKVGDAEICLAAGWFVNIKEIHKKAYSVDETSYRQLKAIRQTESIKR